MLSAFLLASSLDRFVRSAGAPPALLLLLFRPFHRVRPFKLFLPTFVFRLSTSDFRLLATYIPTSPAAYIITFCTSPRELIRNSRVSSASCASWPAATRSPAHSGRECHHCSRLW